MMNYIQTEVFQLSEEECGPVQAFIRGAKRRISGKIWQLFSEGDNELFVCVEVCVFEVSALVGG